MQVLFSRTVDGNLYIDWLLSGLVWTMALWAVSGVIAFVVGIVVGCARSYPNAAIRAIARCYVQIFRNIPLLVQAFLWYFVLPEVLPTSWGDAMKQIPPPWASFFPAVAALSLYTASRIAEQVRAGIGALPEGQRKASHALGMSVVQGYRYVMLPQALRITLPTLTSETLGLLKNTSIALTIGLLEVTAQAQQINEFTFRTFDAFASATLVYLVIALVIHQIAFFLERRVRVPGLRNDA